MRNGNLFPEQKFSFHLSLSSFSLVLVSGVHLSTTNEKTLHWVKTRLNEIRFEYLESGFKMVPKHGFANDFKTAESVDLYLKHNTRR